jgi:hypothetical protein
VVRPFPVRPEFGLKKIREEENPENGKHDKEFDENDNP